MSFKLIRIVIQRLIDAARNRSKCQCHARSRSQYSFSNADSRSAAARSFEGEVDSDTESWVDVTMVDIPATVGSMKSKQHSASHVMP